MDSTETFFKKCLVSKSVGYIYLSLTVAGTQFVDYHL